MYINLLTDNPNSWIIPYVNDLKVKLKKNHKVNHIFNYKNIQKGDVLFILSCEKIIPNKYLKFHKHNIIIHPSALPMGKGWSPLAWQILSGSNKIPITLFEATKEIDAGPIYLMKTINFRGDELNDEIKQKQGEATLELIYEFLKNYNEIKPYPQEGPESYYPKMNKKNNELDVDKSLRSQFNILRIVDNEKYPASFTLNGYEYIIKVYKNEAT